MPKISEVPQLEPDPIIETNSNNKSVQVSISCTELENLRYHCNVLTRKLKHLNNKYSKCLAKVPRWTEKTIRMCTVWRYCSPNPKGMNFVEIIWSNYNKKIQYRGM
jgi:predicted aldo/keto reductase-like oxidoreductase